LQVPSVSPPAEDSADPATLVADAAHIDMSRAQLRLLRAIRDVERCGAWRGDGARDLPHWVSMRYGMSAWKAHRWVGAARVLERLPRVADALADGSLGIDAVVELTRFATPESEHRLVTWARGVSPAAVRRRADRESRRDDSARDDAERDRFLDWWYTDEGRRLGLHGELPADRGAIVVEALERMSADVPEMPNEAGELFDGARRADALVAICERTTLGHHAAAPRRSPGATETEVSAGPPTLVVHATLDALRHGVGSAEVEGGPVVDVQTARRLGCDGRFQVVVEDESGNPFRLGRTRREPTAAMVRALRYRDRECRFPGCGATRFTNAHHIEWWSRGGSTDLENLLLLCSFHHRLVHERGWGVKRRFDGEVRWFRPDGVPYEAGPAPPPPRDIVRGDKQGTSTYPRPGKPKDAAVRALRPL
jgi:hypothetical protein